MSLEYLGKMNQKTLNVGQTKEDYIRMKEREFLELFGDIISDSPMDYKVGNLIERLLYSAVIPEQKEREIHRNLYDNNYTNEEAYEVIKYLNENQSCPINSGRNYTATDIKYKLKNILK